MDKSASVRKKAVQLVAYLCDALASHDASQERAGGAEVLSALFRPLSLVIHPSEESAMAPTEDERKVAKSSSRIHM